MAFGDPKPLVTELDHIEVRNENLDASIDNGVALLDPDEERKILWKIDRRLVTLTGLGYCVCLLDRGNLSAASIAGMTIDLGLQNNNRYSIILLVFFIPYVLFQPPMTLLTRKVGARMFLSTISLLWAGLLVGMGFVKRWDELAGCRVILGALEAGYFPGCVYLLTCWYCRFEIQRRVAVFYVFGCLSSAAGGILAYGLMQLGGTAGLGGWRWILIVEGLITAVIAMLSYIFLVDFPDLASKSWNFLTEREVAHYLEYAKDFKIWLFAMIFLVTNVVNYSILYFLPIILRDGMGFSTAAAQCLVTPPYAFTALWMYATAHIADRYKMRAPIIVFNCAACIIGLPIMSLAKTSGVRYFGIFLVTAGSNSNTPAAVAYQANNIRGVWKRAFSSATLIAFGGIGGIIASTAYRAQDAPGYRPGIWTSFSLNCLNICIVGILTVYFRHCNRKADGGKMVLEGLESFRYTI
ncbi:uncharacterized protein A1O5_11008 [Cladophialophora psammophila CBS 110553]|uniref:Major facilitator superfamily (MFS) profile domain-containing protein n=1 Tax=Cladophialophora psammophila CBS 110553 TaxID=1182543 RepID=W9WCD8_9EURO|nr:uncharacterized protein A1O5_11008 [Cladophialophora psammophila CBS 110553]EXJ65767.1 hypothetical protein A1O5_11008 [Cladophialophora psammophila CBS 110553]